MFNYKDFLVESQEAAIDPERLKSLRQKKFRWPFFFLACSGSYAIASFGILIYILLQGGVQNQCDSSFERLLIICLVASIFFGSTIAYLLLRILRADALFTWNQRNGGLVLEGNLASFSFVPTGPSGKGYILARFKARLPGEMVSVSCVEKFSLESWPDAIPFDQSGLINLKNVSSVPGTAFLIWTGESLAAIGFLKPLTELKPGEKASD